MLFRSNADDVQNRGPTGGLSAGVGGLDEPPDESGRDHRGNRRADVADSPQGGTVERDGELVDGTNADPADNAGDARAGIGDRGEADRSRA